MEFDEAMTLWKRHDLRKFHVLDPRAKLWIAEEFARRKELAPSQHCSSVLLSYPRSGNHLMRFLVEYATGRPTLSAVDHERFAIPFGLHDLPIFLKVTDITVQKSSPILIKRHDILPEDIFTKSVLLVRNPVEAILSHLREVDDEAFEARAGDELRSFRRNVEWFDQQPAESKSSCGIF